MKAKRKFSSIADIVYLTFGAIGITIALFIHTNPFLSMLILVCSLLLGGILMLLINSLLEQNQKILNMQAEIKNIAQSSHSDL